MQNEVIRLAEALKNGKVILYPTDTVWGLGCDATDEKAVEKVFEIKHRPTSKSLIVLVSNFLMLQQYVETVPFRAVELMDEATGPLTVIYPRAKNLAKNLLAEDGSVGIRIPDDEFCKALISALGRPIVSTSANLSGEKPSSIFKNISQQIIDSSDEVCVLRHDDQTIAAPSQIVKVNQDGSVIKIR